MRLRPEAVRSVLVAACRVQHQRGANPEAWFALAVRLLRVECQPAVPALLRAAAYQRLPGAAAVRFARAVRQEPARSMAAAIAWLRREVAAARQAARSSAGARQAQRSAQPGASAAPVAVRRPEAAGALRARVAAAESPAWVAAVARQPAVAGARVIVEPVQVRPRRQPAKLPVVADQRAALEAAALRAEAEDQRAAAVAPERRAEEDHRATANNFRL